MSVVYDAVDTQLERPVAIKVVSSNDPHDRLRFEQEARTAARLHHPNIITIHDVGEQEGSSYLAMERIFGSPLDPARTSPREAARIARDLARALQYAHGEGVIHRDIKPGNILMDRGGKAVLTDFGIAVQLDGRPRITLTGIVLGTPCYMSPEQAHGERHAIDERSDIYSLCAVLYECVVGSPPHQASSMPELLRRAGGEEVPEPSRRGRRVARDLEAVLMKGLELRPERRYPSMEELADDLDRFLAGEPVRARAPSAVERWVRRVRRRPSRAAAAALALVALAAASFSWSVLRRGRERDEELSMRRRAQPHLDRARAALDRAQAMRREEGREREFEDQVRSAASFAEQATGVCPGYEAGWRLLGDAFSLLYHPLGSDPAFRRAEESYGRSLDLRADYVPALLGRGERRMIGYWKDHWVVSFVMTEEGIGSEAVSIGEAGGTELWEGAISDLERAGSGIPEDQAGLRAFARALTTFLKGDYRQAVAACTEAFRLRGRRFCAGCGVSRISSSANMRRPWRI